MSPVPVHTDEEIDAHVEATRDLPHVLSPDERRASLKGARDALVRTLAAEYGNHDDGRDEQHGCG